MLRINFVSQDSRIFSGDAQMIIAPSVSGEIGLLTGHEPIMTVLKVGVVKISSVDENGAAVLTQIEITGGFLSLYADEVSIVADSATIL